ncbi:MAG: helix-turn-helix domain-containing protein, partial [Parvibaculum sp.]
MRFDESRDAAAIVLSAGRDVEIHRKILNNRASARFIIGSMADWQCRVAAFVLRAKTSFQQRWKGSLVSPEKRLAPYGDYSLQAAAARILERHRDHIRTQKPHIAVAKLSKIIEATLKLSNRQGFQAMSLRDLAAAAGLSMGGLYSYFDGKDTLLVMILGEVSSAAEALLEGAP